MSRRNKTEEKILKFLLKELPYYNHKGDISNIHGRFNNLNQTTLPSKRNLNKLKGLYDLDLFQLNTCITENLMTKDLLLTQRILSSYHSPHSFTNLVNKNKADSNFSIFHNNIVSVSKNLETLQTELLSMLDYHFDIIGLTETKITNTNCNEKRPEMEGYEFEFVPTPLVSGGVAMFINDSLDYKILEKTSNVDFQALWIEIALAQQKNIICGIIYRQHNSVNNFMSYFQEAIEKFTSSGKTVYILGDFNICLMKSETSTISNDFLMSLQSCYLIPTIDKPTRVRNNSASLIDNILVNNPNQVLASGNILSDTSDHFCQFCIFRSSKQKQKVTRTKTRDFSRFSEDEFKRDLAQVNWNGIISNGHNNINQIFSAFYNQFNKIVNRHAPMKLLSRRKSKEFSKPWVTQGLRSSIREKNKFFANGNETMYKLYRNRICSLIRVSKKQYFHKYFNDNLNNMKKTWDGINSLLHRKSTKVKSINALKDHFNDNRITKDASRIANVFNKFFASVGANLANKLPISLSNYRDFLWKSRPPNTSFFFRPITPSEVNNEILCLPNNKAHGLYSCPIKLLKCASQTISYFLSEMFNLSLSIGSYPSKLKMSKIIPVFKTDDETDVNNYRPISLLPIFNRLFEKLMYNRMKSFIDKEDILYASQYGFRKGFSTEHAIHEIVNKIQTNMDKRLYSCGIFIDLKKAFDTVDHNILLDKLNFYGFRGIVNDWFRSYLLGRTHTTQIGKQVSVKSSVCCGVPQGSVLGPLLFLIYINDIYRSSNKFEFYLFADDTNLLYAHKNLKTLEMVVNAELKNIYEWLLANKLSLNTKKTNYIIFHPYQKRLDFQPKIYIFDNDSNENVLLECKDSVKYLGILIDKNLSWKQHISSITMKISKLVGLIAKIRHFVPLHTLLSIYQSLILPYLTYGLTVWGQANITYLEKLLLLQKRVVRYIYFAKPRDHAVPLFINANILPISYLYHYSLSILMYNIDKQKVPSNISTLFQYTSNVHSYYTRSSSSKNFYINKCNLEKRKKSLSIYGAKVWNEIPCSVRDLPKTTFKKSLRKTLFDILKKEDSYIESPSINKIFKTYSSCS